MERTPLIRTDFSDEAAWGAVRAQLREPPVELREAFGKMGPRGERMLEALLEGGPPLEFVEDRQFADVQADELLDRFAGARAHGFLFIADQTTMARQHHPALVVDLRKVRGRSFRAAAAQVWAIQSNLSLANMDWEDFSGNLEAGVFRGFPKPPR
jgi:hypothetical protein